MRSYAELLVKTCHRRGAHAIGGMAAFIPSRRDPEVNAVALQKVRDDKEREASQGYDGHLGRASRSRAGGERGVRPRPRRPAEPARGAARGGRRHGRRPPERRGDSGRDHRGWPAQRHLGRDPVPRGLAAGLRRGRDLQPDGGRGHLGDLALAGLAVAPSRQGHAPSRSNGSPTRRWQSSTATTPTRGSSSSRSRPGEEFVEFLTLPAYDRLTELRSQ